MKLKEELRSLNNFIKTIENEVIKNRVEHLLIWYVKKATYYKRMYYMLSIMITIINAIIPVINQLNWELKSLAVTIISSIASIIASIITLLSVKDTWFRYRKYVELLKTECMLFNCRCEQYSCNERERTFIYNIERIISDERDY
ncbi:hypothetical protein AL714_00320 [Clostridium botulinum]|uniref:DUF4231 domain-containing protein n=1 Tax=Clostridium botulinum TaxID=1491 RepID=UPI00099B7B81|nr:DUF4231 domain-containing protein [Clostridium botulinum]OPD38846.1 hypothetical protein AL714_00320 [Clostridium botulinum]